MHISFIKFKLVLCCAVLVLFLTGFANRIVLGRGLIDHTSTLTVNNLPSGFVWTTNLSGLSKDVFQKINYQRKLKRLNVLRWDNDLSDIAYDYSRKMARENFFSHYDKDGNTIVERAEEYDIKNWQKIGENLFQCEGYDNPVDVAVSGWLRSPSHRKNIYDREWTHTGIGVYQTRRGEVYITQVFLKK